MSHSTQSEQEVKNKREWQPHTKWNEGTIDHMGFVTNHVLQNIVIDIANSRRESISGTIRMLLYLGVEKYNLNNKTGITTSAKRQQDSAVKEAEANAIAAKRKSSKRQGKTDISPAVTPILFCGEDIGE